MKIVPEFVIGANVRSYMVHNAITTLFSGSPTVLMVMWLYARVVCAPVVGKWVGARRSRSLALPALHMHQRTLIFTARIGNVRNTSITTLDDMRFELLIISCASQLNGDAYNCNTWRGFLAQRCV